VSRDAPIQERAPFDFIRYGTVWEDGDVLCEALAPAARGGRVLSVASAGDNVLALLTLDPAEVVAVDVSAAQLACLELRLAAFRVLNPVERLELLGIRASDRRRELYRRLREPMGERGRRFWDAHPELVAAGPIHAGKFERYLIAFRRWILPLIHSPGTIRAILALDGLESQRRFYAARWNTWRWRLLFRAFFSRMMMGRFGRDPSFFDHVEGSVGDRILERTRYALTEIPLRTNPWFQYIMTGNYPEDAVPRYLRPEHEEAIRARLDRVRVVQGAVEEVEGRFDGFNLSDIFEYMSAPESDRSYGALIERAAPGARLVYWNMLAPRRRPDSLAGRVRELEALAGALHAKDRAWFYRWLRVEEVTA
jgi:S-adenosylmethionine-diacylglycerol 3-amino-3-carboxypropyl transferase